MPDEVHRPQPRDPADVASTTPVEVATTSTESSDTPISCPPPREEVTLPAVLSAPSTDQPTVDRLPWWWLGVFLVLFLAFAAVVVVLVAQGQNLLVAVGVPATLSGVALGVLGRLGVLARRRRV